MADLVYNRAKNNVTITDLRMLLLVGYTPDPDHATVDAVIAAATGECTFTNYARKALTGEAWAVDDVNDLGQLLADDPPVWADAGGAVNNLVSHAVVFEYVDADDGNNLPVACYEVDLTTNGGDLELNLTDGTVFATD